MKIKEIPCLVLLVLALLLFFGCIDFSPPNTQVPADLEITYSPIGFMIVGQFSAFVDANGAGEVIHSAGLLKKSYPVSITKEELLDIINTAKRISFFSMNEEYVNHYVLDGGSTEIIIKMNGITKRVKLVNYDNPSFYELANKIKALTFDRAGVGYGTTLESDLYEQCDNVLVSQCLGDNNSTTECIITKSICDGRN